MSLIARKNIIRTNAILFIIVILLSLIAWFQPGLHQSAIHYLTSLKANEVNSIIIERQDIGAITLKKQKNGWFLQQPYQLPANPLRVSTITALAERRSYSQFQIDSNELARYQLDKPPVSVWLNGSKFTLGSEESINHQRYAMNIEENSHSEKNTVHLIDGTIFYQLRANLDTFISLALLPPQARIKHIVWSEHKLSIAKGRWTLTPDSAEIPSDNIARFIQFWQHARAGKIETNMSLSMSNAEQLKSPDITISFTTPSSNDSTATESIHYLIIQDGKQIKLLRTDIEVAYWISPQTLKQLTELAAHQISQ
jgi:hypothetical protein